MSVSARVTGEVLNPIGEVRVVPGKLSPRLAGLKEKTVVFMDDNVGPQEPFWRRLGFRIEEAFPGSKTIDRISRGDLLPMHEIEEIAQIADGVVAGVAL